nr:hypothetical protein [Rhodomicrobium sp. Az07]
MWLQAVLGEKAKRCEIEIALKHRRIVDEAPLNCEDEAVSPDMVN